MLLERRRYRHFDISLTKRRGSEAQWHCGSVASLWLTQCRRAASRSLQEKVEPQCGPTLCPVSVKTRRDVGQVYAPVLAQDVLCLSVVCARSQRFNGISSSAEHVLARTHADTHSPSIDRAASCRVIHQTVRHTQVCFTAGRCSAAHSRGRLPPAAWRRTEAGRRKQVGNSYSRRMRIDGGKIVSRQVQQERFCPEVEGTWMHVEDENPVSR